jgi:hypothetical protein
MAGAYPVACTLQENEVNVMHLRLISIFVVLSLVPLLAQTDERPALVRVDAQATRDLVHTLQVLDMDIASVRPEIHLVASAREIETLARRGIPFTVLHRDLVAHYQSGLDNTAARELGLGSMGGYFTYSEVVDRLDEWRTLYPNLITVKQSLGQSHQGRDVWAVKISDNPDTDENEPEAIVDALTHAREPMGMMATLYFMDWVMENYPDDWMAKFLVEHREMWFVPVHNPDGYAYNEQKFPNGGGGWRKNRRKNSSSWGVDLNRNWGYMWGYNNSGSSPNQYSDTYRGPYAMSEPEVQALANFISSRPCKERMSIHTYSGMWLIPWCYDYILTPDDDLLRALATEMAPEDYDVGTPWELLYDVNGGSLDWDYGSEGIITFSPEMTRVGEGAFWPPTQNIVPIAEDNLPSLQYFYAVAGSFVKLKDHAVIEASGNFNGYPDAGETLEVTVELMNMGLADCATPVDVTASTSAPYVNVTSGSTQLSALASRASQGNSADPFVLELLPSAPYNAEFTLDLEIAFDGAITKAGIDIVVGTARRMIVDDLEGDTYWWQLGLPDDTAIAGAWEHGDPIGTWLGPDPVQPEDDGSPSGTQCFVTDNSGGAPSAGDVDGGRTRIMSPKLDLTGGERPRVGYRRWWANLKDTGEEDSADDGFFVGISNDGGETWVNMENTEGQGHNQWESYSFDVEDYVTPSANVRVRFTARDMGGKSLVEAAVDDFWVESYALRPVIGLLGGLKTGETTRFGLSWEPGDSFWIYFSFSKGPGVPIQGGLWYLETPFILLLNSVVPAGGNVQLNLNMPSLPQLVGLDVFFQSFAVPQGGGQALLSNCVGSVIE